MKNLYPVPSGVAKVKRGRTISMQARLGQQLDRLLCR